MNQVVQVAAKYRWRRPSWQGKDISYRLLPFYQQKVEINLATDIWQACMNAALIATAAVSAAFV